MEAENDVFNLFTWDNTRAAIKRLETLLQCNSCEKLAEHATSLGRCEHFFCQSCIGNLENGMCPTCLIPSPPCDNKPDRMILNLIESSRELLKLLPKEDNSVCGAASGVDGKHPCTPPHQIRSTSKTQTLQSLRIFQSNEENNLQKVNKVGSTNPSGSNNKTPGSFNESKTEPKKPKSNLKSKPLGRKSPIEDVKGKVSSGPNFISPDGKQRSILKSPDPTTIRVSPSDNTGNSSNNTTPNSSINKRNAKEETSMIFESKKVKSNAGKTKTLGRKSPDEDVNGSIASRSGFVSPDAKNRSLLKLPNLSILGVSPSVGVGNNSMNNNTVNKRNTKGETLLHVACVKGDVEKVRNLLKAGARPNTKDNAGWTPLHEVCQHGSWDLAKLLLDHGAIIDAPGPSAETPLLDAVINGRDDLIRLLRSYGASDSTRDMFGRTPRTIADRCNAASEMHDALDTKYDTALVLPPICPVMYEKMVLLGSGLSSGKIKSLEKLSKLLRVRVVTEFSVDVTHIVAETQATNDRVCQRTTKYMMGLVAGKWILSHKWLDECLLVGGPVNPVQYEIEGTTHNANSNGPAAARDNTAKMNPGLFNGCHMYLYGTFRPPYPIKKEMEAVIKAGGGVVLGREPNAEDIHQMEQTVPFYAEADSPLSECSHYIIYQEGSMEPQLKYTMKHIKSLPLAWILMCIDHYKLIDPFN